MQYRQLGCSGIEVPVLGLGGWTLGGSAYGAVDRDTAVTAMRTAGRSDVKVLHKDPNDEGLTNVINGGAWLTAASSLEWLAWAGIDQAIRGLTGAPYLGALDLGIGVLLFDADNAPGDLDQDQRFADSVDFRAEYRALWGIG